jgi:hypothetical protein
MKKIDEMNRKEIFDYIMDKSNPLKLREYAIERKLELIYRSHLFKGSVNSFSTLLDFERRAEKAYKKIPRKLRKHAR